MSKHFWCLLGSYDNHGIVSLQTVADELLSDIHKTRLQLSHGEEQLRRQNEAKPPMRQARDTARSILNMTSSDLEYLLNEEELEVCSMLWKLEKYFDMKL